MRKTIIRWAIASGVAYATALAMFGAQAFGDTATRQPVAAAPQAAPAANVQLPGNDSIAVLILSDVGSRLSKQGDTFGVVTTDDYVVNGKLVLPKGSPGYGLITNVQRAGMAKTNGQLAFTITKLVAPNGAEIQTQVSGSTSDALIHYERNGSETMQVILFGMWASAKRGDDLLVKAGETFHIAANGGQLVPSVAAGTAPATLNTAQLSIAPVPQFLPPANPDASAVSAANAAGPSTSIPATAASPSASAPSK